MKSIFDLGAPACPHLQQERLRLGNFAGGDALEGGVLAGVDLHVAQPGEMRHLVYGGRAARKKTANQRPSLPILMQQEALMSPVSASAAERLHRIEQASRC